MDPGDIRWTPLSQQTQAREKKGSAKKKLGFDDLFDVSDPQVDDVDDVVGLCTLGQFATQKSQEEAEKGAGMSQLTQDDLSQEPTQLMNETPDTVILTNNKSTVCIIQFGGRLN